MTHAVAALLITLLTTGGGVDTTIAVKHGTRLEVDNFAGEIKVRTWTRDALRIEASHTRRTRVEINRSASLVRLTAMGRMMPSHVDYQLTVPTWMPLDLHGMSAEIDVGGTRAAVQAKTVNGGVKIVGGAGTVSATSIQGSVEVLNTKGRVEASSVNQAIKLRRIVGDVTAETVNGVIVLDAVDSKSLEASSVNGNIVFLGPMMSGGLYSFSTHNGTLLVGIPDKPNVAVSVATFSGDFSSSIPLSLQHGRRGKRFEFTLGSGSAKLELESFQGSVHLLKIADLAKRLPELEEGDGDEGDQDTWEWQDERWESKPKGKR